MDKHESDLETLYRVIKEKNHISHIIEMLEEGNTEKALQTLKCDVKSLDLVLDIAVAMN